MGGRTATAAHRRSAHTLVGWCATACCVAAAVLQAQDATQSTPPPALAFEVASVKKSGPPDRLAFNFNMQGGRFVVSQMPLAGFITMAYGLPRYQLVGGPGWIYTDRFDINAKAEDGPVPPTAPGTPSRQMLMLRSLLKERFALVVHNETRELPLSYLVLARADRKLGERLHASTVDCAALAAARKQAGAPAFEPPKPGQVPPCGMMMGLGRIAGGSMTMATLASMLSGQLNRPVLDRTNLTGAFDIQVDYTPDQMPQIPPGATLPPGLTPPSPDGPSLTTALQEQLGLKLESTRGPLEVLVVDSVEQPAPD